MTDVSLQRADEADLDRVESLLAANGLPQGDVRDGVAEFFLAYTADPGEADDEARVGVVGLERHGSHGLLRSLVVAEEHRGEGHGAAICDALERDARESGVETLSLLTTTAAPFFRERGYETVERAAVPPRIRETTQFAELCPASATCLAKRL